MFVLPMLCAGGLCALIRVRQESCLGHRLSTPVLVIPRGGIAPSISRSQVYTGGDDQTIPLVVVLTFMSTFQCMVLLVKF